MQEKSLTRFHDPVVVIVAKLGDLPDQDTTRFRLYAVRSGASLEPIPYQFDARGDDGELVLDGSHEERFVLDGNDELVFMAKDTGARVDPSVLPLGSDAALEIEVIDPLDGGRGFAYLVHFDAVAPPASTTFYATFDPATNEVRARFYAVRYPPGRSYFTGMQILPEAGGSGKNIVDRMKVRIEATFSFLLTTWSPRFTEDDFSVRIDGVKNGPVRAVRRVRQSLDLGRFFPEMPGGTVYTYYYFSSFATPSTFSLPWLPFKALKELHFTGTTDFLRGAAGMTYWDGANLDGRRYADQGNPPLDTTRDHEWWAIGGAAGSCVHIFEIPPEWKKWGVTRGSVFIDDAALVDPAGPESEAGSHAAGYQLLHMDRIRRAGDYSLNMAVVFLPRLYEPGAEKGPVAMLAHPVLAQVNRIR